MEIIDQFSSIIDTVLEHQGLKAADYARLTGLSKVTISRYLYSAVENGYLQRIQARYVRGKRFSLEISEYQK